MKLRLDPYFYAWTLRFLFQCTTAKMRANTLVKLRLALHSRACINRIEEETGIAYDQRKKGILYFFRSQQSFDTGTDNYRFLGEHGLPIEIVDRKRLVELEPGLASAAEKIAGGVYSPIDQTGDSRLFATRLAAYVEEKLGVKFLFGTRVDGLDVEGDRVTAVSARQTALLPPTPSCCRSGRRAACSAAATASTCRLSGERLCGDHTR